MNDESTIVRKGGETMARYNLVRSKFGLNFTIWIHPDIEEAMRSISEGLELLPVGAFGRFWNSATPLMAYDTSSSGIRTGQEDPRYGIESLGAPLWIVDGRNPEGGFTNLAFLRLVGASEGTGVSFTIRGVVMSEEAVRTLDRRISKALAAFYRTFMLPINLTTFLTSQEN